MSRRQQGQGSVISPTRAVQTACSQQQCVATHTEDFLSGTSYLLKYPFVLLNFKIKESEIMVFDSLLIVIKGGINE